MAQLGFHHNTDICIGCRACVIACKDKNDLPLGEKYRRVYDYSGCSWDTSDDGICTPNNAFAYSLSTACNHCAEPACMASCPAEAIIKREEDGIVYIDLAKCISCGNCVGACPYSVPYTSTATGLVHKCNFCIDLIDNGEKPMCVAACVTRALEYGDLAELKAKNGELNNLAPLPQDPYTGPSAIYTPSRLNPDGAFIGEVRNAPEEITSETA